MVNFKFNNISFLNLVLRESIRIYIWQELDNLRYQTLIAFKITSRDQSWAEENKEEEKYRWSRKSSCEGDTGKYNFIYQIKDCKMAASFNLEWGRDEKTNQTPFYINLNLLLASLNPSSIHSLLTIFRVTSQIHRSHINKLSPSLQNSPLLPAVDLGWKGDKALMAKVTWMPASNLTGVVPPSKL